MTNKGFTLIELLVVVLIIGILTSIAVPQYTKAVDKARATEAMTIGKSVSDAMNLYYLQNNKHYGGGCDFSRAETFLEIPDLKYFDLGTNGTGSYGCGASNCDVCLNAKNGTNASIVFHNVRGKLDSRYCSGSECSSLFTCSSMGTSNYCYF